MHAFLEFLVAPVPGWWFYAAAIGMIVFQQLGIREMKRHTASLRSSNDLIAECLATARLQSELIGIFKTRIEAYEAESKKLASDNETLKTMMEE